jgi:DNA-binding NarL/FixJ family response regulator
MTPATESTSSPIRVVIAEDQVFVRRATMLLLSMAPDMECVGQACNGDEAVQLAKVLRPDVVLMDLHMPVKNGVVATREITFDDPTIQVLALTTLDDTETVFEAVRAGAQAYLLKDVDEDELLETIRALRLGQSRLTPPIARKVLDQFRYFARLVEPSSSSLHRGPGDHQGSTAPVKRVPISKLTETEERVLTLMTDGANNLEIAHATALAEVTIRNYVSRIIQKLHVNARMELGLNRPTLDSGERPP